MNSTRQLGDESVHSDTIDALPAQTTLHGGDYVVARALGQGGFGITYLAKDTRLDRDLVIKECFPEALCIRNGLDLAVRSKAREPQFRKCVDMFLAEARSIAKLTHPNIVNVYTVFEENQTAYMVLDLIDGPDLLDIVDVQGIKLSPGQIDEITTKMLDALELVHGKNLLHRDISPDNILLAQSGQPTLIDFGAARDFVTDPSKGTTGFLFVKDGYSPFEFYVPGATVSPASDLYALGGTIYHLVTGEAPPSSQKRQLDIQANGADPYQPLTGRFPDFRPAFLKAVDKAMQLAVPERIQSAQDWLRMITVKQGDTRAAPQTAPGVLTSSLADLVSETNEYVLRTEPDAKDAPMVLDDTTAAKSYRPDWRDEFNRETEETVFVAQDADEDPAPVDDWAEDASDASSKQVADRINNIFSRDDNDPAPAPVGPEVRAYLPPQIDNVRRYRGGSNFATGLKYLGGGLVLLIVASFVAVNHEYVRNEWSFDAFFSSQGFCDNEFITTNSPVEINCSGAQHVKTIDFNSRDMILELEPVSTFTSDR